LLLIESSARAGAQSQEKMEQAKFNKEAHGTARAYARRRQFSRHHLDASIKASVFREGQTSTCWGRTAELGEDGIGATLSGELKVGEVVSLEFSLPLPPRLMKLRAVVRYREGLRCGFEFLILTEKQKLILREVCSALPPSL
jgi:hypothetical protein